MRHKHLMEYSVAEELVHAITHGIGVILSIVGLSWMLFVSTRPQVTAWATVCRAGPAES